MDLEDLDKQLVKNGSLTFKKEGFEKKLVLSDDGLVESYTNGVLNDTESFSKITLIRESKRIIAEGYELLNEDNDQEYLYMLLDRLKQDCEYYLGNGQRDAEHCLWAKNEQGQIAKMREIYNKLKEKPDWLTEEDIDKYERLMVGIEPLVSHEDAQKEVQDMLDRNYEKEKKVELGEDKIINPVKDAADALGIEKDSEEFYQLSDIANERNLEQEFNNLSKEEQQEYLDCIPENKSTCSPALINELAQQYNLDRALLYWVVNIRNLNEAEINTSNSNNVDLEKEKENIQNKLDTATEIQALKQELDDKVDDILEEDIQKKNEKDTISMTLSEFKNQIENAFYNEFPESKITFSKGPLGGESLYINMYLAKDKNEEINGYFDNDILGISFLVAGDLYGNKSFSDDELLPEQLVLEPYQKRILIKPENKFMAYGSENLSFRKIKGTPEKIVSTITKYINVLKNTLQRLVDEDKIHDNHIDLVRRKLNTKKDIKTESSNLNKELIDRMEDPDNFKYTFYFADHIDEIEEIINNCKDEEKLKTYKKVLKAAQAIVKARKDKKEKKTEVSKKLATKKVELPDEKYAEIEYDTEDNHVSKIWYTDDNGSTEFMYDENKEEFYGFDNPNGNFLTRAESTAIKSAIDDIKNNKETKNESQVSNYTLQQIGECLKDSSNDFTMQISGSDSKTKWLNLDKEDVQKIYNALSYKKKKTEKKEMRNESQFQRRNLGYNLLNRKKEESFSNKLNANKIQNFVKESIQWLLDVNEGCCEYELDNDLSIFCGWSNGYDRNDDVGIKPLDDPNSTWRINVAIKSNHEYLKTDFDWLSFPFDEKTGEVWDTSLTVEKEGLSVSDANWLIEQYEEMRKAIDNEELSLK